MSWNDFEQKSIIQVSPEPARLAGVWSSWRFKVLIGGIVAMPTQKGVADMC